MIDMAPAPPSARRTVLVTGGSRGIGRAVARRFAADGARVAVHFRADDAAARATLASLPGEGHLLFPADLSDPDRAPGLVDAVVAQAGRLHVLVNNAGVYDELDPLTADWAAWRAHWHTALAVNLLAAAHLTWAAGRHMAASGGGRIVNVSSRGAFRGEPTAPAYGASKAGLNALAGSMAQALAPAGVTVATVAPGFVATDMAAEVLDGPRGEAIRAQSPLGRVATAEEVAAAVVWLASEDARYATGAVLDLNGASHLRT